MDVNELYLMKSVPSSRWFLPRDHRETHVANAFDQCITKAKLRAHHTTGQKTERILVGQGIVTLSRKARRPKRCWTTVPKNHFCWVRIRVSFTRKDLYSFSSNMDLQQLLSTWIKSSENTYSEKGKGFATTTESGSTMFLSSVFWVRSLHKHYIAVCFLQDK